MALLKENLRVECLPKTSIYNLSYKLNAQEFKCKCTREECHYTLISNKLITAWGSVRVKFLRPLKVNSGYRCQAHNAYVGGSKHSSHTTGNAVDISTDEFTPNQRVELMKLAETYFDYVKIYPTFIHCQING